MRENTGGSGGGLPVSQLFRAPIFHTPGNPFHQSNALEVFGDGGLLVNANRIEALGDFATIARQYPNAEVRDLSDGFLLPGFVDTHVHFPQVRVLGALGEPLLDWLKHSALPEESRMADATYARVIAREFLNALTANGTTAALVFGAHFASAMEILFDEAAISGQRISSGLVLSDRLLLPELHTSAAQAYKQSTDLIQRYHGKHGLKYAVTPRFALSASEAMLEVCQTLMRENPDVLFQTHLNENYDEIREVAQLFPESQDYLSVYEKFGLVGVRSVLAHNVHPTNSELQRLSASGATVAHCPCSNASLGSGLFPMAKHISHGIKVSLGTDVGAGTGFGMLKEGLQAYMLQRIATDGFGLTPTHLLYLATRAGAEALGMDDAGDLSPGRSADFVYIKPRAGSPLAAVAGNAESPERMLAAIFTLAGAETIAGTWVQGRAVYEGVS